MKKKIFIIYIIISFVIGGAIVIILTGIMENKVTFEKKLECAKFQKMVKEFILENYGGYGFEYNQESNSVWMDKIFYSSKLDSCVYIERERHTWHDVSYLVYRLYDVLTGEKIHLTRGCFPKTEKCNDTALTEEIFLKEIKKYE